MESHKVIFLNFLNHFFNPSVTKMIEIQVTISFVTRGANYWPIDHDLK